MNELDQYDLPEVHPPLQSDKQLDTLLAALRRSREAEVRSIKIVMWSLGVLIGLTSGLLIFVIAG